MGGGSCRTRGGLRKQRQGRDRRHGRHRGRCSPQRQRAGQLSAAHRRGGSDSLLLLHRYRQGRGDRLPSVQGSRHASGRLTGTQSYPQHLGQHQGLHPQIRQPRQGRQGADLLHVLRRRDFLRQRVACRDRGRSPDQPERGSESKDDGAASFRHGSDRHGARGPGRNHALADQ